MIVLYNQKLKMKIQPTTYVLGVIAIALVFWGLLRTPGYTKRSVTNIPTMPAIVETVPAEVEQSQQTVIVSGNPRFNPDQKFSPPNDSVAVTNEEQLRLLIEQTRPQFAAQEKP